MDEKNLRALRDLIQSAQASIHSAKKLISTYIGDEDGDDYFSTD
jgi:hypothetical protein